MLSDIIIECPVCGHPFDSHIDNLGKFHRCPECDNLWELQRSDVIEQPYNEPISLDDLYDNWLRIKE